MTWNQTDCGYLLKLLGSSVQLLKNKRILITGGSGFLGSVLTKSLSEVNSRAALDLKIFVIGRDETNFTKRFGRDSEIKFFKGDVLEIDDSSFSFDFVIHSAQSPTVTVAASEKIKSLEHLKRSTEKISRMTARNNAKLIYLSSGAALGSQENFYSQSKLESEQVVDEISENLHLRYLILRCYSFMGPEMPLDQGFAASKVISQALLEHRISMDGDGSPVRSYMYSLDFAVWTILMMISEHDKGTYDIGSSEAVSILELCSRVAKKLALGSPTFLGNPNTSIGATSIYLPNSEETKTVFKLPEHLKLNETLDRTLSWARQVLSKDPN